MRCKGLTHADKGSIERGLRARQRHLSAYSFAQFAVWQGIYRVEWMRCEGALCVFFKDALGSFMNCEPLGQDITPAAVTAAFAAMDRCNPNKAYSRIENVEENRIGFYRALGYEAVAKGGEYVYERARLARLAGDPYKSKRAGVNYFTKTYAADYAPYLPRHRQACLDLYDRWAEQRAATSSDRIYIGMLKDSRSCLDVALRRPSALGLVGRIVAVSGVIRAFTIGYGLNADTFCIMYETADLSFKGISQYIFRRFCQEMEQYRFINAMDDSGLARLQAVKRSYRPAAVIPAYIVQRPHA
ncbi:MAG TPA: phosphatidylglycerol lysyltransferase domain-containing protein [Candidatus Omnitrophota bacterium]|nr:DUF2156 domain-containing protein [Candidatus Omnitrophota bacterium]HNQ49921.1 phosphatidylglycerol lysyltransferase domain-containing protein [Candidatus Omnitrophota bacterium]HQO37313.1 phosphatidylglycerol lysyltransferase domain-containing protein [Candidatus Omnitrophota bacterium]HQQ05758.1 phosphatidylglycerol lysyltransferase domain-containing protein [Candidatus Omnitrophota bacterium]